MPPERTRNTNDIDPFDRGSSIGGGGAQDGNHNPYPTMALDGADTRFRSYRNQGFASPSAPPGGSTNDWELYTTYPSTPPSSASGSYSSFGPSPFPSPLSVSHASLAPYTTYPSTPSSSASGSYSSFGSSTFPSPLSTSHASLGSSYPTTPSSFGVPSPYTPGYASPSPYPTTPSTETDPTHASSHSYPSILAPSLSRTRTRNRNRTRTAANPGRPPNAFIIFRTEYASLHTPSAGEKTDQTAISIDAAARWREMSEEDRGVYEERAMVVKEEHALRFPDFEYDANVKNRGGRARKRKEKMASAELTSKKPTTRRLRKNVKANANAKEKKQKKEIKAGQDGRTKASTTFTEGFGVFRMEINAPPPPIAPSLLVSEPEPPSQSQSQNEGAAEDGDVTDVSASTNVNAPGSHVTANNSSRTAISGWEHNARLLQMSSQSRYLQHFLANNIGVGVGVGGTPHSAYDHQPLDGYQHVQTPNFSTAGQEAVGSGYHNPMFNAPTAYAPFADGNGPSYSYPPSNFPASFYTTPSVPSSYQANQAHQFLPGNFTSPPYTISDVYGMEAMYAPPPPRPVFNAISTPNSSLPEPEDLEYNDFGPLANSDATMHMAGGVQEVQPTPPFPYSDMALGGICTNTTPTPTKAQLDEPLDLNENEQRDMVPGYYAYGNSDNGNAGPSQPSPSSSYPPLAYAHGASSTSSHNEARFIANERHRPLAIRRARNLPGPGPPASGSGSSSSSAQRQPEHECSGFAGWGRGRNVRR